MSENPEAGGSGAQEEQGKVSASPELQFQPQPAHGTGPAWGLPGKSPSLGQAGPAFCSWSLSIEKKKGATILLRKIPNMTHRSRDGTLQSPSSSRIHTCPPADAAQAPAPST